MIGTTASRVPHPFSFTERVGYRAHGSTVLPPPCRPFKLDVVPHTIKAYNPTRPGMLSILLKLLRHTAFVTLAVLILLFAIIQINQHLLRHRAEQLHADILALQLHPGTFADLQRLQTKWGAYATYPGTCTPASCRYHIALKDWSGQRGYPESRTARILAKTYYFFGGRAVSVGAEVLLHDDHMWKESYLIMLQGKYYSYRANQPDRLCDSGCSLFAAVRESPHLFSSSENYYAQALNTGYKVGFEGFCTGCVGVDIDFTHQTSADKIRQFTRIDFSCVTRWLGCQTEAELVPDAWPLRHNFEHRAPSEQAIPFDKQELAFAPVSALGQEALNAVAVQIINRTDPTIDPTGKYGQGLVLILDRLKNSHEFDPGSTTHAEFSVDQLVQSGGTLPQLGDNFIAVYRPTYSSLFKGPEWLAWIPDTPANRADFLRGAALDSSGGDSD